MVRYYLSMIEKHCLESSGCLQPNYAVYCSLRKMLQGQFREIILIQKYNTHMSPIFCILLELA